MKKVFFLLAILFGLSGNVWGQSASMLVNKTDVTCKGKDDGTITVQIFNVTGAYNVKVVRGTTEYGRVNNTNATQITFPDIPYSAQSYSVQVVRVVVNGETITDGSIILAQGGIVIEQPTDAFEVFSGPISVHGTCGGKGSITITVVGGTPDYTFTLTDYEQVTQESGKKTFSDLDEGFYTLEVNDSHGCGPFLYENIEISTTPIVQAREDESKRVDVACKGDDSGEITIIAEGGTGGFYFILDNYIETGYSDGEWTFTGLDAGIHWITVYDDNWGCPVDLYPEIIEPNAPLSVVITPSPVVGCLGFSTGMIEVTGITGGKPDYTITLSPDPNYESTKTGTSAIFDNLPAGSYTVTVKDANGCEISDLKEVDQPEKMEVVAVAGITTCNSSDDGTITVTVTGGTEPYTYSIDGVNFQNDALFTDIIPGTYTVTVKDAYECTETVDDIIVGRASRIKANITHDPDPACVKDQGNIILTVEASDKTEREFLYAIYSLSGIEWQESHQFTNLVGGNYHIMVKYKDVIYEACAQLDTTYFILVPKQINISLSSTPISCNGGDNGAITVTATGGTGIYSYSIDGEHYQSGNTFGGLTPGLYTIYVMDNNANCPYPETQTIELANPDPMVITNIQRTNISCFGENTGSVKVTVEGGITPYESYTWEKEISEEVWDEIPVTGPEAADLVAGKYRVTVVDFSGECSVTEEIIIEQPASELKFIDKQVQHITCNGGTDGSIKVEVSGGTPEYKYSLSGQTGDPTPTEDSEFLFSGLTKGNYQIIVTDANGCTEATDPIQIQEPTPIAGSFDVDKTITCNGNDDGILTFNASGGMIVGDPTIPTYSYQWSHDPELTTETATNLAAGDYQITVSVGTNCEKTFTYTLADPEKITATRDSTHVTCYGENDGTITLHITGGTQPYDVTWEGPDSYNSTDVAISDLAPGEYIYLITDDNSCPAITGSVTIEEPSKISEVQIISEPIECAYESTSLTVRVTLDPENETDREQLRFRINGGAWQADSIFYDISVGEHTAQVGYRSSEIEVKCVTDASITITARPVITIGSVTPLTPVVIPCDELTAQIIITASGENGTDDLEYRFVPKSAPNEQWQTSNEFNVRAGLYTACVRYATEPGCPVCYDDDIVIKRDIDIDIEQPVQVFGSPLDCADDETASILIKATTGEVGKKLEYGLKKGSSTSWQLENGLFENLGAGDYEILVRYENDDDCYQSGGVYSITAPDKIVIDHVLIDGSKIDHTEKSCPDEPVTITVVASGSQQMEYSIDNGINWQDDPEFTDQGNGNYTIKARYKDGAKCEAFYNKPVTVFIPEAITIVDVILPDGTNFDCAGETTTITIQATGESNMEYRPMQFSIDGGVSWYTSPNFSNVSSGLYEPRVRYANYPACTPAQYADIEITAPAPIVIGSVVPNDSELPCDGTTTKIDVVIISSEADDNPEYALEYSLDETNWYDSANELPEVTPGAFTVYVRYAPPYTGCTVQMSGSVKGSNGINQVVATVNKTNDLSCNGKVIITVTADPSDENLLYRIYSSDPDVGWQPNPEFVITVGGSYIFQAAYNDNIYCPQSSDIITISKPVAITKVEVDYGKTELDCNGDKTNITVYVQAQVGKNIVFNLYHEGILVITQTNNPVFSGIGEGDYEIGVSYDDPDACEVSYNRVIRITQPKAIEIDGVRLGAQCEQALLIIDISDYDHSRTLEYSADGINWYSSNVLMVTSDTYDHVQVRYLQPDYPSCTVSYGSAVVVPEPDMITASVTVDKTIIDCDAPEYVLITVTATTNSVRTLQYSYDGGTTWGEDPTLQVDIPGLYSVWVRFDGSPDCWKEAGEIIIQGSADIRFADISIETPIACYGGKGSITATIISALPDLHLSIDGMNWIPVESGVPYSFKDLNTGRYSVSAQSNSTPGSGYECLVVSTPPIELTEPALMTAFVIGKNAATGCYNQEIKGTVTIGVTGGTAPYRYKVDSEPNWRPDEFTGTITIHLNSGNHDIHITDANDECQEVEVVPVIISNSDIVDFVAVTSSIRCFGEASGQLTIRVTQGVVPFTVNVSASPSFDIQGNPISPGYNKTFTIYNYSDAIVINDLFANTYLISVTGNNDCGKNEYVTIIQPNRPLTLTIDPINICPGESLGDYETHVNGGWPDYKLYWNYNNQSFDDSDFGPMPLTSQSPQPKTLQPGYYRVIAEDVAMCRDTSKFEIINIAEIEVEEYKAYGVSCNSDNTGSIKIKYQANNAGRDFVYRVRYQNGGGIVPGYGEYRRLENDSIFGLGKGSYMVEILDQQGMGCMPKTIQNIEIGEFRIEIIDRLDPDCNQTGFIDFEVWSSTSDITVSLNGESLTSEESDTQPLKFHVELNKGGGVIIVATDNNGCTKTWSENIPYTTDLVFDRVETTPNFCPDDKNATITALAYDQMSSLHTAFTYRLYRDTVTITNHLVEEITTANLDEPVVFSNLSNGTYTLSMQADVLPVGTGGCFSKDEIVEIVNTNKIELIDVNVINNCPQGVVFTIVGDPSNKSYTYSVNGSDPMSVGVPVVNGKATDVSIWLSPGKYDITIYYGEDGCKYTRQFDIVSKVKPIITSHDVTACHGAKTGSIDIKMPDGSGIPYQYWYSGPDHESEKYKPMSSTTWNATISQLGAGYYGVVVQQVGNCLSDTVWVTIEDAPALDINFNVTSPTCKGKYDGEIEFIIHDDDGSYRIEAIEYPNGDAPESNNLILSNVTVGHYIIAVTNDVCTETFEIDIDAPQAITIKASIPENTACSSSGNTMPITVEVIEPESGTFEYYFNTLLLETSSERIRTFDFPKGEYHIVVKEEGDDCFADTIIIINNIPQPIELDVAVDISRDESCNGIASIVVNSITGGVGPYEIKLNNTIDLFVDTPVGPLPSGTYHIEVWDSSPDRCYQDITKEIQLLQGISDVTADIENTSCDQKTDGRITLNSPSDYTYEWHDENHTTGNRLIDLGAGDYTVTITTTDSDSELRCSVEKVYTVKTGVNINVAIVAVGEDTHFFCPGADVKLNGTVTINGEAMGPTTNASANWVLGSQVWEFLPNNPLEFTATEGMVTLIASSDKCQSSATFEMEIKPTPTVTFAVNTIYIPDGEVYELKMVAPTSYTNYQWISIPDGYAQNLPAPPATVNLPSSATPYQLILNLTDDNGCSSGDTVMVNRALDFFIPNAFTPNEDGYHDKWEFRNIEQYIGFYEIQVVVFNKSGMQVYEGKGYNNSSVVWDGRRNGYDLPIGTYYYVVELVPRSSSTGQKYTFKGSVTIQR